MADLIRIDNQEFLAHKIAGWEEETTTGGDKVFNLILETGTRVELVRHKYDPKTPGQDYYEQFEQDMNNLKEFLCNELGVD